MSLAYTVSFLSSRHTEILAELAALDYTPSALESAQSYARDLQTMVPPAEKALKTAEWDMKKERGEHNDAKQSVFRKFAYRATGQATKWDERASKEEREYLDAHERWIKETHTLDALKASVAEAEQHVHELQGEMARRERLQRELEDMYKHVFDGPSPEMPQDDALEWAARRAEDENNRVQAILAQESQALSLLAEARTTLKQCEAKMKDCVHASQADIWGAGGSAADILEHNALTAAQMLGAQFLSQWAHAQRLHSAISPAPTIALPRASMTDVVFDNIFTDMNQHDKILRGLESVRAAQKATQAEIARAQGRVDAAAAEARPVADGVQSARETLHAFRRSAFEQLAARSGPPAYDQQQQQQQQGAGPQPEYSFSPPSAPPPFFPARPNAPPLPSLPSGLLPSFPVFSSEPDQQQQQLPSGPPSSFPVFSAEPEQQQHQAPAAPWASMNPYAALLVRRSTLDAQPLPEKSDAAP